MSKISIARRAALAELAETVEAGGQISVDDVTDTIAAVDDLAMKLKRNRQSMRELLVCATNNTFANRSVFKDRAATAVPKLLRAIAEFDAALDSLFERE